MTDWLRTGLAILAGTLAWVVAVVVGTIIATTLFVTESRASGHELTVQLPLTYLAANLVVSLLAAAAGGWLAGRLDDPGRWRPVVGLVLVVIVVSATNMRAPMSAIGTLEWYPWLVMAISALGAGLGGWSRRSAVDVPRSHEPPHV